MLWEETAPCLSAHGLQYLRDNGWGTVNLAMHDFVRGCEAFLATLESTYLSVDDKQTICIVCFSCLRDGMEFDVTWDDEDGAEQRWYRCTLRKLPCAYAYLQEQSSAMLPMWLGIEDCVRRASGPWQVESNEFEGTDIVLFDAFLDTWRVR
jgi:hypothetical protein